VAVLNDSKYGWDKPADNVLRLTLLHTGKARAYPYQSSNDLGHHRFVYSIAGHGGDWRGEREASVPARAAELNQPSIAFQTEAHAGELGRVFSIVSLTDNEGQIAVRALKQAEDSDEIVLRVQELYGRPVTTNIRFGLPFRSAREINAAEEKAVGSLSFTPNGLQISLKPYQPRTIAVRLKTQPAPASTDATVLDLPFNLDGVSTDANRADGDFDGKKQTLASELLPPELSLDGVQFKLGPRAPGALNVLAPKGENIPIPRGPYNRLYVLAAAVGGDASTTIDVGAKAPQQINVREWQGPIGQWDSRLKEPRQLREVYVAPMTRGQSWTADAIQDDLVVSYDPATGNVSGIDQIRPGFVKRDEVAWVGTHRHGPDGNQPYIASYIFAYAIDLPPGTRAVRLPNDPRIRIFAMTAARVPYHLWPARALYAAELPEP
jgi:alpha-mannosidase